MQGAREIEVVSPRIVALVAVVLLVLAGFGTYQGWRRSLTDPDVAAEVGVTTAPLAPGARSASPLTEATSATLTEAQIRDIARQEARSVLGRPASSEAAASAGAADTEAHPALTPPRPTPAVVLPPAPPLQTPTPPSPAPADNAPLF